MLCSLRFWVRHYTHLHHRTRDGERCLGVHQGLRRVECGVAPRMMSTVDMKSVAANAVTIRSRVWPSCKSGRGAPQQPSGQLDWLAWLMGRRWNITPAPSPEEQTG